MYSSKTDLNIERKKLLLFLRDEFFNQVPECAENLSTSKYTNDDIIEYHKYLDKLQITVNRVIDLTRSVLVKPQQ